MKPQIIVPVKLAGKGQFVMFAYPCQDAKMETVLKPWSATAGMDGLEDFAKFVSLTKFYRLHILNTLDGAAWSLSNPVLQK